VKKETTAIYHGGHIVTVNDAQPQAEALAVKGGKIIAVGPLDEVKKVVGAPRMVDLNGHTLLPGFIDGHSHLSLVADTFGYAGLGCGSMGTVQDIDGLKQQMIEHRKRTNPKPGDWIIGYGYDPSKMAEDRHPTKHDLDEVSTDHPVVAFHFSGHMIEVNSKLLEMVSYTEQTPNPPGGHIQRFEGTNEPNGVLEEMAGFKVREMMPKRSPAEKTDDLEKALERYIAAGYTTVQDGAVFDPADFEVLSQAAEKGRFAVDVVGYPFYAKHPQLMKHYRPAGQYRNHFRIGGAKIVLDGGLPGYTAYLREPYHKPLPGMATDYRAYPFYTNQEQINTWFAEFYEKGWPHLCHALGDAAIDQMLDAVEFAENKHPGKKLRPIMVHAIVMGEDQLDRAKRLGAQITFFSAHNHVFSDFHVSDTVGPERGARINPAASAGKRGINYTLHHDAPVIPIISQLFLMWAAVNRVGESGEVHGPDQCISPLEALKASTIYAAYQYFEENTKGSLESGKLADMVILSENPLAVDPMDIRDIEILETIKEGVTVYQR